MRTKNYFSVLIKSGLAIGMLAALGLAAGCSGTPTTPAGEAVPPLPDIHAVSVTAVDGDGHPLESPVVTTKPGEGSAELKVMLGPDEAATTGSIFLRLSYDPLQQSVSRVELDPGLSQTALLLAVESEPGTQLVGITGIGEATLGNAAGNLCTVSMGAPASPATRTVTAAPGTPVDDLQFVSDDALTWTCYKTGDYDQNGEVGITDITPVGLHFGKNSASPSWGAARVADGDGNGEVNASDLTRIGLNFGTRVTSFVVRESASASGPFTSISATVGFNAFPIPGGGGPRPFSYTLPSPQPDHYYAVYARDGTELAAQHSNAVQYMGIATPDIYTLDSSVGTGNYNSIGVIGGGLLAVSYTDVTEPLDKQAAKLVRSTTSDALGFFSPLVVIDRNEVTYSSLTFDGASCYITSQTGFSLQIARTSGDGATYLGGLNIVGDMTAIGFFPSTVRLSTGQLAVVYGDNTDFLGGDISFIRTNDVFPTVTLPNIASGGLDVCGGPSMAVIAGRPCCLFLKAIDLEVSSLHFAQAGGALGNSWNSPVTLLAEADIQIAPRMLIGNGSVPLVFYYDTAAGQIRCIAATSSDGLVWKSPVTVASPDITWWSRYSAAMIDGKPAVAYIDDADGKMKLIRANDTDGQSWGAPVEVTSGNLEFISMCEFNGKPAIAFRDIAADSLKVAIYR